MECPFQIHGNRGLITASTPIAMTFGNFDGVHKGHQDLVRSLKYLAGELPCVLVTFDPHPATVFAPDKPKLQITTLDQKIHLLFKLGVQTVVVQPFDTAFSSMTSQEFCENWLSRYFNPRLVLLGYDYSYGAGRKGDFSHMKAYGQEHGFVVKQGKPVSSGGAYVSSTRVREALQRGDMQEARQLLGRHYALEGVIVQGDQKGRLMGFPTANMKTCNGLIPAHGVYACLVQLENETTLHPAVLNCGHRPTMGLGLQLQIEAHIFDFNRDIYGQKAHFHFVKYLRSERKFANLDDLKSQITLDAKMARDVFDWLLGEG